MPRLSRILVTAAVVAAGVLVTSGGPATASRPSAEAGVFAPGTSPYDVPYRTWVSRYMKWFETIPTPINPAADPDSPRNCAPRGPAVYLGPSGTGQGCDVEAGRALLFTYTGTACFNDGPKFDTYRELEACVDKWFKRYWGDGRIVIKVDGDRVPRTRRWTLTSRRMVVDYPKDNIWGAAPGPTMDMAKAVYLMLKPLPRGDHLIVGRWVPDDGKPQITRFPITVR